MASIYEIQLRPQQAQKLRLAIGSVTTADGNITSVIYTLHVRWNQFLATWVMDIHDEFDNPLAIGGLNGVPLVTGTDLLGQYRNLGIGGGLPMIVMTIGPGHSPDELPTYDNLGIDSHLYFKSAI